MTKLNTFDFSTNYPEGTMKNLSDIVGMFAFPFQTEIAFVAAIYPTAKNLTVSTRGHIGQKQYWSAWLCVMLLMVYVGFAAAVVWAVVPSA